jgi:branched-chain amino acid aminotransferase
MAKAPPTYLLNGILISGQSERDLFSNRAFRLGDGFFETIRVVNGIIPFMEAHMSRMKATCAAMGMELGESMKPHPLRESMARLLDAKGLTGGGRLRLTIFREGEGAYAPESNRAAYLAEAVAHHPNFYGLEDRGSTVGIFTAEEKAVTRLSAFKVLGNHLSIRAAAWAAEMNLNEAILINANRRLVETTSGNLFIVSGGSVKTPPLKDGGVAGVMRMLVINTCLALGIPIFECSLEEADLLEADEVFYTNAIRGPVWVGSFRDKRYYHKISNRLVEAINRRISETEKV